MKKEVIIGEEARIILSKGVNLICDAVKVTLGPKGKNVLVASDYMKPRILNDGVTIANEIESSDELLNIGINIVKETAVKTNDKVGDGTTTSLVLLQELFNECLKEIKNGYSPMKLKQEINCSLEKVNKYINKNSKKIKTLKEVQNVALISSSDYEVSNIIKKVYSKIGLNSSLIIEDNRNPKLEFEFVNGFEIKNGYASIDLLEENTSDNEIENVEVIIYNEVFNDYKLELKNNTLILADDFEEDIIKFFIESNRVSDYKVFLVKLPFYSEVRNECIKDINVFLDNELADKVKIFKDKTILIKNKKNINKIIDRVDFIKKEISLSDSEYEKEIYETRISNLIGNTSIIKVGAETELERIEKKYRIEDAINSVKNAIKSGISLGGGMTFYNASKILDISSSKGEEILKRSLLKPLKQIIINSGYNEKEIINELENKKYGIGFDAENEKFVHVFKNGIIDSTNVVLSALKTSISICTMLITTEVIVLNKNENMIFNKNEDL